MWTISEHDQHLAIDLTDGVDDLEQPLTALAAYLQERPEATWLIDFNGLQLANSSSLALLMRALNAVKQAGGRLAAHGAGERLAVALRVIKATNWLSLHDDSQTAGNHLAISVDHG